MYKHTVVNKYKFSYELLNFFFKKKFEFQKIKIELEDCKHTQLQFIQIIINFNIPEDIFNYMCAEVIEEIEGIVTIDHESVVYFINTRNFILLSDITRLASYISNFSEHVFIAYFYCFNLCLPENIATEILTVRCRHIPSLNEIEFYFSIASLYLYKTHGGRFTRSEDTSGLKKCAQNIEKNQNLIGYRSWEFIQVIKDSLILKTKELIINKRIKGALKIEQETKTEQINAYDTEKIYYLYQILNSYRIPVDSLIKLNIEQFLISILEKYSLKDLKEIDLKIVKKLILAYCNYFI